VTDPMSGGDATSRGHLNADSGAGWRLPSLRDIEAAKAGAEPPAGDIAEQAVSKSETEIGGSTEADAAEIGGSGGVVPPLAIGSDTWPGLAKLAEECGELLQVIGKLAAYPDGGDHPDGQGPLRQRLEDELADVSAAMEFVLQANADVLVERAARRLTKLTRFWRWHMEARAS
jgi:NTP pyrophosphatase (non-canonical NTP hydrolase)